MKTCSCQTGNCSTAVLLLLCVRHSKLHRISIKFTTKSQQSSLDAPSHEQVLNISIITFTERDSTNSWGQQIFFSPPKQKNAAVGGQKEFSCRSSSVSSCLTFHFHPVSVRVSRVVSFFPSFSSRSENSEICPDEKQRNKATSDEVQTTLPPCSLLHAYRWFQCEHVNTQIFHICSCTLQDPNKSLTLRLPASPPTSICGVHCPLSWLLPWFPCCQDNCQVLYIHNLPTSVTQNMLRKRLQVFGKAEDCKVIICNE